MSATTRWGLPEGSQEAKARWTPTWAGGRTCIDQWWPSTLKEAPAPGRSRQPVPVPGSSRAGRAGTTTVMCSEGGPRACSLEVGLSDILVLDRRRIGRRERYCPQGKPSVRRLRRRTSPVPTSRIRSRPVDVEVSERPPDDGRVARADNDRSYGPRRSASRPRRWRASLHRRRSGRRPAPPAARPSHPHVNLNPVTGAGDLLASSPRP